MHANDDNLYWYKAELGRVVDGDTVDVMLDKGMSDYKFWRIRFYGFDAYEMFSGDFRDRGKLAKEHLLQILLEAASVPPYRIYVRTARDNMGVYSRLEAELYIRTAEGFLDVNETLRARGFDRHQPELWEGANRQSRVILRVDDFTEITKLKPFPHKALAGHEPPDRR